MLIWLEGNLSPQELRDKMEEDPQFKQRMFEWLESIIKCELPGTVDIVEEPDGVALSKPAIDDPHPTSVPAPNIESMSDEDFDVAYNEFVEWLVKAHNWHTHTFTCWK